MKKVLLVMLALAMSATMVACGSANNDDVNDNVNDNNGVVDGVENDDNANVDDENGDNANVGDAENNEEATATVGALELLESAWANFDEENKLYYMGGYYDNFVEQAPAAFDHTNTDNLANLLIVPADAAAYLDDCASLFHAMNFNNFTCGSYHVADTANVETFISLVKDSIANNQWMCGFPEVLDVITVGENNVVIVFGDSTLVSDFTTALLVSYPDAVITESYI